jgi:acetoin utilization protein AcuB
MTTDVVTVTPDTSIGEAITLMRDGNFRQLPVVEEDRLVGIVTDRDLRQATDSPLVLREKWYDEFLLDEIKVKSCMTVNPITVSPDMTVLDAVHLLRQFKFGGLPVIKGDTLVGIVTLIDVLDFLIERLEKEQGERAVAA